MNFHIPILYIAETKLTVMDESVGSNKLMSSCSLKLIGVYFVQKLIFDYHVDELCRKAGLTLSLFVE